VSRAPVRQIVAALLGGFAAGGLLVGVLSLLNHGAGFASCTAMTGFGWTVPLMAGLIIGGVSLLLLDGTGDDSHAAFTDGSLTTTCSSCGSPIRADWRMCPHCGSMLECDMHVVTSGVAER